MRSQRACLPRSTMFHSKRGEKNAFNSECLLYTFAIIGRRKRKRSNKLPTYLLAKICFVFFWLNQHGPFETNCCPPGVYRANRSRNTTRLCFKLFLMFLAKGWSVCNDSYAELWLLCKTPRLYKLVGHFVARNFYLCEEELPWISWWEHLHGTIWHGDDLYSTFF